MLKVIETFSGIGSQAKALERIHKKNHNFNYEIVATCEWEISAIYAYDLIHNGKQQLRKYDNFSKENLIDFLRNKNLSTDGKNPITISQLQRMPIQQLKAITHSIELNNNLVDITKVSAKNLPYADLLTYSFPCQDLSISGFWWNNTSGIDPNSGNRSSLLWQIGRILNEYDNIKKEKPKFLLMENVTAIQSPLHLDNFNQWIKMLQELGYTVNEPIQLNSNNFGVPQNRIRTYMLSVRGGHQTSEITQYIKTSNLFKSKQNNSMKNFLKLDYNIPKYKKEALENIPNYTPSRIKIYNNNVILARGNKLTGEIAKTITTKQDRNPNAGLIEHEFNFDKSSKLAPYRYLTPRETFLLMGFDESDFDILKDENLPLSSSRKFLSDSKLLKLSGNSIVVNVLEAIFIEIANINNIYFKNNDIINDISYKKFKEHLDL